MENCIFCEKIKNNDGLIMNCGDYWKAFWDGFPVSKGHALIIPTKHYESISDIDDPAYINSLAQFIINVKQYLTDLYHPDGFNIGINDGEYAGQSINHLHIHIIPRYKGDVENPRGGVRGVIPNKQNY